jgi:hypothetical protein
MSALREPKNGKVHAAAGGPEDVEMNDKDLENPNRPKSPSSRAAGTPDRPSDAGDSGMDANLRPEPPEGDPRPDPVLVAPRVRTMADLGSLILFVIYEFLLYIF